MGLFLTLSQNGTEFSVQLPVSSYSIASVILFYFKYSAFRPDQCGSVGWASFHKVEGRQLDSQLGHMPRLQVPPRMGVQERRLISNPVSVSLSH